MSEYQPDKTGTHFMYVMEAEKDSPIDKCSDRISAKVHSKEECEELIAVLKKLGFALKVSRVASTQIIEDKFPSDEGEEEDGEEE